MWIGFSLYHNSVMSTIPQGLSIQIVPIQPKFDTETLENLKKREKIEPILEAEFTILTEDLSSPSSKLSSPSSKIEDNLP